MRFSSADIEVDARRRRRRQRRADDQGPHAARCAPRLGHPGARGPVRRDPPRPRARGRRRSPPLRPGVEPAAPQGRPRARQRREADRQPRVHAGLAMLRVLAINGSLRTGSHNGALLRAAAALLPPDVELVELTGPGAHPAYNEDHDGSPPPPTVAALRGRAGARRRRPHQHARVQLVDPGPAQERAGLGVAPVPRQRPARQAGRGGRSEHRHVRRRVGAGRAAQGPAHDRRARRRSRAAGALRPRALRRRAGGWRTTWCARSSRTSWASSWPAPGAGSAPASPPSRWRHERGAVHARARDRGRRRRAPPPRARPARRRTAAARLARPPTRAAGHAAGARVGGEPAPGRRAQGARGLADGAARASRADFTPPSSPVAASARRSRRSPRARRSRCGSWARCSSAPPRRSRWPPTTWSASR